MEEISFDTWEEFLAQPSEVSCRGSVYRGLGNHTWGLETTLERAGRENEAFADYYRKIQIVRTAIESHTEKRWDVPDNIDYDNLCPELLWRTPDCLPAYEFMIYLRHHGFPSPFLDWTQSRYIAAFFAFIDADPEKSDRCSVYEYKCFGEEDNTRSFYGGEDTSRICSMGHTIRTHKRHYLQQAEYTFCVKKTKTTGLVFSPHKEGQCLYVKKCTLPVSEKQKALKMLQQMNITTHTLFGTEDALIKALATEEYVIRASGIPYAAIKALGLN